MTPRSDGQRWAEVLSTFDEIVELDKRSLGTRLRSIEASDPELRRSLEELLSADAEAESRLAYLEQALRSPEHSADPLKLAGRTVSHFRIMEPLASGGMGVVYRAEDVRLRRIIALKFPLPSRDYDPMTKARFLREARVAGAVDHPNVCGIYEAGETEDGHLFYAMPLYEGETLKARLARDGALPVADAVAIARQIAHALSAAHSAGIVHRDLKPANVMLLPDGMVKILDFGLAKATDLSLTASQMMMGTVSYVAPEQLRDGAADQRSDLWALGVVLYEMLTGRRPFEGPSHVAVAYAIVHNEPVRATVLRDDIDRALGDIVHRLLQKERGRRFQSAGEVAAALAGVRTAVARRPSRSRPRAAGVAVTLLLALTAGAFMARGRIASSSMPRSIAVLPFEGYLGTPLSDAIGTSLLRHRDLLVPGHASATLTGRVERVGDSVRVDAQLLDAETTNAIWSRRYEGSATELHGIQRDVARELVGALRVTLTSAERALLDRPATRSGSAYDLYLRGRDLELRTVRTQYGGRRLPIENIRQAQSLYARARDLDPSFALARARLAHMLMMGAATYDTTPARREQARLEAETALRLHPGLPEAHSALAAFWLFGSSDVPRAIEHLQLATDAAPNSAELRVALAGAYRRAGRWEDAVAHYQRAMQLDPRDVRAPVEAAFTLVRLRRDEEAMRAFDRAIALAPDLHMVKVIKGHTYLRWKGTVDTLESVLRSVPSDWDPDGMTTWARYTVLRVQRRDRQALAMLDASGSELSRDGLVYQPIALMRAQSYEALGDRANARAQYVVARAVLADSAAVRPRDASIRVSLGLAYAGLGRKADAIREARRAMELAPVSQNSPGATAFMGVAIEVFGRVGELDEAFKLLELLLAMPAGREVTIPFLRLWPGFDPLRGDPRFQELIDRFAGR